MQTSQQAHAYVAAFLERHGAARIDQEAFELAGEGEAALEAARQTLEAALRRELPSAVAFALAGGFVVAVRERLARPKH